MHVLSCAALMRSAIAQCTKIESIGSGRLRAWLVSEIALSPGQFGIARFTSCNDPYLSRTLFPVEIGDQGFVIELGTEDPFLRFLYPGEYLSMLGPVGRIAPLLPYATNVLLVGDSQPQILFPLAAQALERSSEVTLLLTEPYPVEALDPQIEVRSGVLPQMLDDFSGWAHQIFIQSHDALPTPLHHNARHCADEAYALISTAMPCGTGACHACAIQCRRGWRLGCRDGPIFKLADLEPEHG